MIPKLFKTIFTLILFYLSFTNFNAQSLNSNVSKDTLRVGVAGTAPFYFTQQNSSAPEGISVEIWEKIAAEQNWNFKYENFKSVPDALQSLNEGKLDVLVGPITITSQRVENFRFSQPFYQSSLAIVYQKGNFSLWNLVKLLFSYKLIIAIGIFLIILTIVGTLFWLAERKASPEQFPSNPAKGIGNGIWLAIVTMSTTGYGDRAPITLTGRIIAGTWMVVSIISATSMIAGIASVLTFSNLQGVSINNIEQLNGKKVVTISGSPSIEFLQEYNIKVVTVLTLNDAIEKLKNKKVDAIVYDRPQLMYYLKNHEDEDFEMAKAEYYKQGYGFAFPKNSKLTHNVNRSLLELSENQETNKIFEDFLGKEEN
ncbi:transporter substrate-binding domain-containing protein [Halpernia sp.]|uniref:transporter substrate-binding domain-containing protein n=1 Tax=Halpernia sp. TaxID=2782209 RepID=UPI003A92A9D6